MSNGYRRGYGPQPTSSYTPYSKYPNFAGALGQFLESMRMMKEFRARQAQQKFQRNIQQQQLDIQRERLAQPKEPSITERRWEKADFNVGVGAWTQAQGDKYKMSGQLPEPRVKYPATTATNVKGLFKITDEEWKNLPSQQKGAYFKEFQLRTRPSAAPKKTPEEIAATKKFEWHKNLLKPTLTRLNKERASIIKRLPKDYEGYPGILSESEKAFTNHLKNVDDAINFLGGAENWIASGKPLGKRMEDALKQLSSNMYRVRTGKTMEGIRASWAKEGGLTPDKYRIGEVRTKADGTAWKYIGNDKWQQIK